jgi:predicted nuclease with TOPRIM domain
MMNVEEKLDLLYKLGLETKDRLDKLESAFTATNDRLENLEAKIDSLQSELADFKAEANQRFDRLEKRLDRIEDQQMEDRKIIMDMWREKDKVTATFSRTFAFLNIFIASLVSGFVAFFVKR